ncbi:hypothetical protein GSF04_19330 [Pseudoalteromonas sp. A22]|uniref:hypothetical protein n=1 Tax=Pseudoalteromonas TaxID=53246 RepID=UPI001BA6D9F0|nr:MULTISPECIES: hypothetical protein [Pseudoalteromonas]QUI64515.1 hypothetical protein GSF04_19330 [Pseudoalteromonas sp. A22]USE70224.1 hypothetical protein CTT31_14285 [Pseudoalteromonas flavipulchra]
MKSFTFAIFLSSATSFSTHAISTCPELVMPVNAVELVWPSLPAGGIDENGLLEIIEIEFIVELDGKTSDIAILDSKPKWFSRAAHHTISSTVFSPPPFRCSKQMKLRYELPRT